MSQTQDPISQPRPTEPHSTEEGSDGKTTYWRSLEQLQDPAGFADKHADEFAAGAAEAPALDDVSRRNFLGIVAASAAMAGMTSCRKPVTRILPFAKRPEDMVPGNPNYYATAHVHNGIGTGILVKSSDGRPTKIEGNPLHPGSARPGDKAGGTNNLMQAELLNMYDPKRSHHPVDNSHAGHGHADEGTGHGDDHGGGGEPAHESMADFVAFWASHKPANGAGLHVLVEPTSSPSIQAALANLKKKLPNTTVHTWAPVNCSVSNATTKMVYGRELDTQYDLTKANVVVSFECDFQALDGNTVRNARDYATRRRITSEKDTDKLARLYVVESFHSVTGSNADHRFRVRPSEVRDVVMALAHELKSTHKLPLSGNFAAYGKDLADKYTYLGKTFIPILAKDLADNKGKCAVVIGPRLSADVQVVLHAINHALGNVNSTVSYTETPVGRRGDCTKSIADLATAMDNGTAKTVVFLGGNPVYDAPTDLDFAAKLAKVETSIHLSQFVDETSSHCTWHVNQTHQLEAWGDILSHEGTATLMQPLIAPLYHGISTLELLALMADGMVKTKVKVDDKDKDVELLPRGYDLVRAYWKTKATGSFETYWARALHDGVVPSTAAARISVRPNGTAVATAAGMQGPARTGSQTGIEVQFRPDYNMHDGRYANNAWLQELPDAMTKITWDNAALTSLKTMTALGLEQGDVAEFELEGLKVKAPVWVLPGHADNTFTMALGYGRSMGEEFTVANGSGFNAYALRSTKAQDHGADLKVTATGDTYKIAVTQEHGTMEGRNLVRENDTLGYEEHPTFAPDANPLAVTAKVQYEAEKKHAEEMMGDEHKRHGHKVHVEKKTADDLNQSLWKPGDLPEHFDYSKGYQWGMVIDLNTCIGCNACVSACVSENNIATVGKEQIAVGREMFWNRIDRYFGSDEKSDFKHEGLTPKFNAIPPAENPKVVHQMVPCMQCENAPCEVVCPVAATTHSPEGLNDMAYNRCIGTRYCGNNCPYRVRRFNYLDYHGDVPAQTKMTRNPDVTIRSRGVMEKCTYCVQRINRGKIEAKREGRPLNDGDISTACEQSCPTQAITFGNIVDKDSRVAKLKSSNLNYALLAELNTRPRTTYLAKIRNPNPALARQS